MRACSLYMAYRVTRTYARKSNLPYDTACPPARRSLKLTSNDKENAQVRRDNQQSWSHQIVELEKQKPKGSSG